MPELNDDDEAYLIVSEEHMKKVTMPDTIWAKIGDDNQLEVIRWDIIEMYATEYDSLGRGGKDRSQTHVICKLLMLVRDQERKRHAAK